MNYQEFIAAKSQSGLDHGFDPSWMPDFLMDIEEVEGGEE